MAKVSIFLDTNIVVDAMLDREDSAASIALLLKGSQLHIGMYVSTPTIATSFYLGSKIIGRQKANSLLAEFLRWVHIVPQSKEDILLALSLPIVDLEDAMQYQAAQKSECTYLATRDIAFQSLGFTKPEILSPQLILGRLKSDV
jgi:predicted nucleic acid-binding protein